MFKRFIIIFSVVSFSFLFLAESGYAASKKRKRKKRGGQWAIVKVDGAAVYKFPNFDAPVVEYFDKSKKVRISKKKYKAVNGLGIFYKVRIRRKVYGYITDVDVNVRGVVATPKPFKGGKSSPFGTDKLMEEESSPGSQGFYLTRYAGLGFSSINYSEKINGTSEAAQTSLFGLKMNGPLGIMGGMPLDVDLYIATRAPSFYDNYFIQHSGFMLHTSASIMVPAIELKSFMAYYLGGLSFIYTKFDVVPNTTPSLPAIDSQEMKLGILGGLGAAYRFGSFVLRGDLKYHYEKSGYMGFGASLQYQY